MSKKKKIDVDKVFKILAYIATILRILAAVKDLRD